MYRIIYWNNKSQLEKIDTYNYWNNEKEEAKKEWDIRDNNFKKMEKYLRNSGLCNDLVKALKHSGLINQTGIKGIECGGGVCWSASIIFKYLNIITMDFLEFSEYRITKIAPLVLEHYKIPEDKIKLVVGSFYEIKIPDQSMDFVLLSQAFHHAADVECLLREIHRILKKRGIVIIIGEHNLGKKYTWCCIKNLLLDILFGNYNSDRWMLYKQCGCIGLDKRLGDRYYPIWSYMKLFRKYKFQCKRIRTSKKEHFDFVLWKK